MALERQVGGGEGSHCLGAGPQRQVLGEAHYLGNQRQGECLGKSRLAWGLAILNCLQRISWQRQGPWKAEGKAREVCIRTEEDEDMKCPLNLVTTHW